MAHSEIRALTGLRGVAAVYVMVYHFAAIGPGVAVPPLSAQQFLHHGYLSLDLFFVLSGFVMALTYHDTFAGRLRSGPRGRWGAFTVFLGHRVARLYPLYIVLTLVSAAVRGSGLIHSKPIPDFGATFAANILMVQSWTASPSLVSTAWSVSSEWGAYVALPVLLAVCVGGGRWLAWLAGLLAACVVVLLATTTAFGVPFDERSGQLDIFHTTLATSLRCLAEFCLGLLTYRVYRTSSAARLQAFARASPAVFAAMVGACLWPDLDLLWVAMAPLLILGLAQDRGVVAGVLAGARAHRLGVLSYAIYLVAPNATKAAIAGGSALAARGVPFAHAIVFALLGALVVFVAHFAHELIERPGRRWLRRRFDQFEWTRDARPRPMLQRSTGR